MESREGGINGFLNIKTVIADGGENKLNELLHFGINFHCSD